LNSFGVLLFGHGFDTRGLFITCTYFFPSHHTFFSWVCGFLFANSKKYCTGFIFSDGFWQLNFLWVLLLGHGFETRRQFINCRYFFSFPLYNFWMSLRVSFSEFIKYRNGFIFWDGFFRLNFFGVWLFAYGLGTRGLFIMCTFFFRSTIHLFPEFGDFILGSKWGNRSQSLRNHYLFWTIIDYVAQTFLDFSKIIILYVPYML